MVKLDVENSVDSSQGFDGTTPDECSPVFNPENVINIQHEGNNKFGTPSYSDLEKVMTTMMNLTMMVVML